MLRSPRTIAAKALSNRPATHIRYGVSRRIQVEANILRLRISRAKCPPAIQTENRGSRLAPSCPRIAIRPRAPSWQRSRPPSPISSTGSINLPAGGGGHSSADESHSSRDEKNGGPTRHGQRLVKEQSACHGGQHVSDRSHRSDITQVCPAKQCELSCKTYDQ